MAGSARYTAILDANVLYPNLLRDLLLSLASISTQPSHISGCARAITPSEHNGIYCHLLPVVAS
jgi:hypothetical protein